MMKRSDLAALLEVDYTEDQLDAITAPVEPLLVVAGAGSGKTAVMAARVVWLVGTGAVAADQVLGLTFTNKAAASLGSRITRALETARLVDPAESGPLVATYHSFAGQLLSDYGIRVGVEPHARIITDAARAQLALRVLCDTTLPLVAVTGRPVSQVSSVLALDDALAEQDCSIADLIAHDQHLIGVVDGLDKTTVVVRNSREIAAKRIELAQLVAEFRQAKHDADLIDFADQIRLALHVVQTYPDVVSALREQYPAVLLDEYQDTSVAQRMLLARLFGEGHNVTAVGDPLQAIYGWRGASVDNIESFPQHFPLLDGRAAAELSLAANMRSGVHILQGANEIAAPLRAEHPSVRPLTQGNPQRGAGAVRLALHETWADELTWVVDRIVEQLEAGVVPDDIAILTRRTSEMIEIDAALAQRGVPTSVAAIEGILAIPEVVDLVSILELLADPTANIALVRALAGPRWAIGPRDLAGLARRARDLAESHRAVPVKDATVAEQVGAKLVVDPVDVIALIDAVEDPGPAAISTEATARCVEFSQELRRLRRYVDAPLADLVMRVASVTGLERELSASPTLVSRNRAAVLAAFVDLAANFAGLDGEADLASFLAWLRAGDDLGAAPSLTIPPAPGSVTLLTVHRAKGLEWPVVVVPALTRTVFPNDKSRPRHTSNAHVVPHSLRADGAALPADPEPIKADHDRFDAELREVARLEELRLGYVATTRAERLLLASGSWWGPTQKTKRGPSELLTALREAALAGAGVVDEWAEEPVDTENPHLGDGTVVPFTQHLTSAEADRRRELAAQVTNYLRLDVDDAALIDSIEFLTPSDAEFFQAFDADIEQVRARVLADRSRTREVAVPATLTATQLQQLAADPDAYARQLARPMPSAPRPAASRGSQLHRAIEQRFGAAALLDLEDLAGAADPNVAATDVADLLAAFDASAWAERVPRAVEWPFALSVGGRLLRGRVDAVFAGSSVPLDAVPSASDVNDQSVLTDPASVVLVDWKTGRPGSGDPLQLAVYRLAWSRAHGIDPSLVRACFVHWPSGAVVTPAEFATSNEILALLAPQPSIGNDH